ncbi:MAG: hypothetical protein RL204_581 [Bacteroidota bacterium]|jgi:hypothetical protein
MKVFSTLVGVFASTFLIAQVEIVSSNLPDANDVLVQQNAILLTDIDPEISGPNAVWNFDFDVLEPMNTTTTTNCLDVSSTPFTFQFLFNNPFDADHNSDFAIGVDQFDVAGMLTVEDAYFYYQNRSDRYAITGMGASLNSIPLGAQGEPVDVVYELPLNYEDQSTSDSELLFTLPETFTYRLQQSRSNNVDGWGTINIWGQSFDVLRCRTEIEANDSVYVNQFGFGFALDRPLSVEYKWLSPNYKVPILQITTTGGVVSSVLVADIYTSVEENESSTFAMYPNPASDNFRINGDFTPNDLMTIVNAQGQIVYNGNIPSSRTIDTSAFANGLYVVSIYSEKETRSKTLIIE